MNYPAPTLCKGLYAPFVTEVSGSHILGSVIYDGYTRIRSVWGQGPLNEYWAVLVAPGELPRLVNIVIDSDKPQEIVAAVQAAFPAWEPIEVNGRPFTWEPF
jgi:hypothetical protein